MKMSGIDFINQTVDMYHKISPSGNRNTNTNLKQMPVAHESKGYHLRIGSSENEAITATGFSDGASLSIFKAEEYSTQNPIMLVKYWDKNGNLQEIKMNAKEVNPSKVNYMERLALSAYYDTEGISKDSIASFMTSNIGLEGTVKEETYSSLMEKRNFMEQVKEWKQMQYNNGNLVGYQQFAKYYALLSEALIERSRI